MLVVQHLSVPEAIGVALGLGERFPKISRHK